MKRVLLLTILMIALSLTTTSCDKGHDPQQANGTSDTGGGIVEKATEADIRAAAPRAWSIVTSPKFFDVIERATRPKIIVFPSPEGDKFNAAMKSLGQSDLSSLVTYNSVYILEKGACPAKDKTNADASVSEFTLKGKICLSLENLKLLPKEGILKHIAGLFAHELSHMFGFNESTAVLVQNRTVEGFPAFMGLAVLDIPFQLNSSFQSLWTSISTVSFLLRDDQKTPEDRANELRVHMGSMIEATRTIMHFMKQQGPGEIFYLPEMKKDEDAVFSEIEKFHLFTKEKALISNAVLLGPDFEKVFFDQRDQVNVVFEKFHNIMFYYKLKETE